MLSHFDHTVLMRKDRPASARDAALQKLSRVNRWAIAGSVALTGVLSEVAAQAFPGKTVHAGAAAKSGSAQTGANNSSGSTATPPRALHPPEQAPQAAPESAPEQTPSESAPAQESTPSQPAQESTPSQPAQESTPAAPAQEAAPSQESAPAVSGGS
jgi:outer membrane biosynthesis protein TonB